MSEPVKKMSSFNPHIFKAFYDWLVENQITPHLVVNADKPGVQVPREYVHQHMIILSISPLATRDFNINQRGITFTARFHGVEQFVCVPFNAMQELFAVETSVSYPISLWMTEQEDDEEPITAASAQKSAETPLDLRETGAQFAPLSMGSEGSEAEDKDDGLPSFTILKDDPK